MRRTPTALTIAGSDSGGGAGIAADLKAFARCGVHGTAAITAITAQNTLGVDAIELVSPKMIVAQVKAVVDDIGVDAVKVGMLGSAETVRTVAGILAGLPAGTPVVIDPVMVSESGATLLADDAMEAMLELLLPEASVLTPNLIEAKALVSRAAGRGLSRAAGRGRSLLGGNASPAAQGLAAKDAAKEDDRASAAGEPSTTGGDDDLLRALVGLGPTAVVLTGGHRIESRSAPSPAQSVDLLLRGQDVREVIEIAGPRYVSKAAHGSGCTHSAALAAALALGYDLEAAARHARVIAGEAVRDGLSDLGGGPGPVDAIGLRDVRLGARASLRR